MFSIEIFEKCRLRIAGVNCVGINGAVYTPSFTSSFFIALSTQKFSLYRLQVDDHRAMPIVLCNIHTLLTI